MQILNLKRSKLNSVMLHIIITSLCDLYGYIKCKSQCVLHWLHDYLCSAEPFLRRRKFQSDRKDRSFEAWTFPLNLRSHRSMNGADSACFNLHAALGSFHEIRESLK